MDGHFSALPYVSLSTAYRLYASTSDPVLGCTEADLRHTRTSGSCRLLQHGDRVDSGRCRLRLGRHHSNRVPCLPAPRVPEGLAPENRESNVVVTSSVILTTVDGTCYLAEGVCGQQKKKMSGALQQYIYFFRCLRMVGGIWQRECAGSGKKNERRSTAVHILVPMSSGERLRLFSQLGEDLKENDAQRYIPRTYH